MGFSLTCYNATNENNGLIFFLAQVARAVSMFFSLGVLATNNGVTSDA
jgi:hypothetical protein